MFASLLLAVAAVAAEPPSLEYAMYLFDRQEYQRSVTAATEVLNADPGNLAAHSQYIWSRARLSADAASLVPLYRTWHAEDPSTAATFGLAKSINAVNYELKPSQCEEIDTLLASLPAEAAYFAQHTRMQASEDCGWDEEPIHEAIAALEGPRAWAYIVYRRAKAEEDVSADIPRLLETYPRYAKWMARSAFSQKTKAARANRRALLAAIEPLIDAEDPVGLHVAVTVLEAADDKRADDVAERLDALDPLQESTPSEERDPLYTKIYEADRRPTHELGLAGLDDLEKDIPDDGPIRAAWLSRRADRLAALGRHDDAYLAHKAAAAANPESGNLTNAWAYEASKRGEDLEEALAAIERVMPQLDDAPFDPGGWRSYEGWAEGRHRSFGAWEDTRGWLLFGLGRLDEAIVALTHAVSSYPEPTLQGHLGLALVAKGEDRQAFAHLSRTGVDRITDDPELAAQIREELERLYPTWGAWHPAGLDGYLGAVDASDDEASAEETSRPHSLIGQALPFESVDKVGGGTLDFSDVKQITVIDLWATWCGPCVAGMPHLQEVAEAYADRGVKVYGLSVDGKLDEVRRFFKGFDQPAYSLGFLGREGFEIMDVSGIPSLFVVGPDGKVAEYFSGYGGEGDTRLEEAIDRLLEPAKEPDSAG